MELICVDCGYGDTKVKTIDKLYKFSTKIQTAMSNDGNFVDIMDKGVPVAIFMQQDIFTNKMSKDVICTYFMSRIRLAMSRRKDFNKIAHVIIDDLH